MGNVGIKDAGITKLFDEPLLDVKLEGFSDLAEVQRFLLLLKDFVAAFSKGQKVIA